MNIEGESEVIAFKLFLMPGQRDEYKRRHDEIWPELENALREAGIIEYHIFNAPDDNILFAVMRRRVDNQIEQLAHTDVMRRWWEMMKDVTVTASEGRPVQSDLDLMYRMGRI
jgi:L-rhamnose mutarotase